MRGLPIALSIVSMILCALALLLPWYSFEEMYVYSDGAETTDRIAQYEFLVNDVWYTLSTPERDLFTTHLSYDEDLHLQDVEKLFWITGLLCVLCIVVIAVSITAFVLRIRKIASLSAAPALGLALGALIVFTVGFPRAASAEGFPAVEGLFGTREAYDEYLDITLATQWGASYAWWLMIGTASTILAQIIIVRRVTGDRLDSELKT